MAKINSLINEQLCKKLKKEKPKKKASNKKDIFDNYGHGIKAYFRMLWYLICIFGLITLLIMPVCYLYSKGTAYEHHEGHSTLRFTLGNLG